MERQSLIVMLIGCLTCDFVFGNNEINFSYEEDVKKSKDVDEEVALSFQSYHKSGFKNAIKYNLISYMLIAPSIIKVYEPLVFALPLFPNIIDGLALKKLKKELNLLEENSINSNLKNIRNRYIRSFIVTNLMANFTAYFFIDWLESGVVILS